MGSRPFSRAVEILHAFKLGHAFQRAVEAIFPAVIGTLQDFGLAARLGHDGRGVMAAYVVEGAQLPSLPRTTTIGSPARRVVTKSPGFCN